MAHGQQVSRIMLKYVDKPSTVSLYNTGGRLSPARQLATSTHPGHIHLDCIDNICPFECGILAANCLAARSAAIIYKPIPELVTASANPVIHQSLINVKLL